MHVKHYSYGLNIYVSTYLPIYIYIKYNNVMNMHPKKTLTEHFWCEYVFHAPAALIFMFVFLSKFVCLCRW